MNEERVNRLIKNIATLFFIVQSSDDWKLGDVIPVTPEMKFNALEFELNKMIENLSKSPEYSSKLADEVNDWLENKDKINYLGIEVMQVMGAAMLQAKINQQKESKDD